MRRQLAAINSSVIPIGPEISGSCSYPSAQFDYLQYFMNRSHHTGQYTPPVGSYHCGLSATNVTAEAFFDQWDDALAGFVPAASEMLADGQQLVLNEFVNFVTDWCDCRGVRYPHIVCPGWKAPGDRCPDWQREDTSGGDPDLTQGKGVRINRDTWSWNAAAGVFAYAFGTLAERGYLVVGQDQLVAGTWPDNEPAVAMLDWVTGDPNAKYFVTQLLSSTVGAAVEKALYACTITSSGSANSAESETTIGTSECNTANIYVLPFQFTTAGGSKGALVVNKRGVSVDIVLADLSGATATVVEVAPIGFEGGAGFQPPLTRQVSSTGHISLGPFAVAVVLT